MPLDRDEVRIQVSKELKKHLTTGLNRMVDEDKYSESLIPSKTYPKGTAVEFWSGKLDGLTEILRGKNPAYQHLHLSQDDAQETFGKMLSECAGKVTGNIMSGPSA